MLWGCAPRLSGVSPTSSARGSRTHTDGILNPAPLPIGLERSATPRVVLGVRGGPFRPVSSEVSVRCQGLEPWRLPATATHQPPFPVRLVTYIKLTMRYAVTELCDTPQCGLVDVHGDCGAATPVRPGPGGFTVHVPLPLWVRLTHLSEISPLGTVQARAGGTCGPVHHFA